MNHSQFNWYTYKRSGTYARKLKQKHSEIRSNISSSHNQPEDNAGTSGLSIDNSVNNNNISEIPIEIPNNNNESSQQYAQSGVIEEKYNIAELLSNWALIFNISQSALNALLCILIVFFPELPKDARTLLHTPKKIKLVAETEDDANPYWYHGVEEALSKKMKNVTEDISIALNFNMDGLPIYNSSKGSFWPILFNIHNMPHISPMVAGIYHCVNGSKPSNLDRYLNPFVKEMLKIFETGIIINGYKIDISIRCFICDSPARAMAKGNILLANILCY